MCGYFSGLSSPSVTEMTTTLRVLAEVEQGRADEVADVLDEHARCRPRARASRARWATIVGVEVAAGAGVDLHGAGARPADPLGVEEGLLVALDHARPAGRSSAMVRSSSVVLPGPGELIRLSAVMPRSVEPARGCCAASSSFLASTATSSSSVCVRRPGVGLDVHVAVAVRHGRVVVRRGGASWSCGLVALTDRRHTRLAVAAAAGRAHVRPPPPTSPRARRPDSSATSALPQSHSRNGSSRSKSVPHVRQCARPLLLGDLERRALERGARRGQLEAEASGRPGRRRTAGRRAGARR